MKRQVLALAMGFWVTTQVVLAQAPPVTAEHLVEPARLTLGEPLLLYPGVEVDSLSRVNALGLDGAGNIYLADSFSHELRVLDGSSGELIRTIPLGETTQQVIGVAVARDTIAVTALVPGARENRVRLFHATGSEIDHFSFGMPWSGSIPVLWATDSGWMVLWNSRPPAAGTPGDLVQDSMTLFALDMSSPTLTEQRAFPVGAPRVMVTENSSLQVDLAHAPTLDVARDGAVYVVPSDDFTVEVYSAPGEPKRSVRANIARLPYNDQDFRARLERRIARAEEACPGCDRATILREHAVRVGHAEDYPVMGGILASRGGRFMVRRSDLLGPRRSDGLASRWDVISIDSGVIGRVEIPSGVQISRFAWPYIYARLGISHRDPRIRYKLIGPN